MIKRTVEISQQPTHLATRDSQLVLSRGGIKVGSIPCEDLGIVVVDHPSSSYTHAALAALAENAASLVVCGRNHLPVAVLMPVGDHPQIVWRLQSQIAASLPLRKRLWQQIVKAKLLAQARNLPDGPAKTRIQSLAAEVKSGDPKNHEAQAARAYWAVWLSAIEQDSACIVDRFYRDPEGATPNNLLNYGYAVMRAAVARAIVAAGFVPALGLHHRNRGNAFCLADDLVEPLRPLVDARVRDLLAAGRTELDQPTKAELLELLAVPVITDGISGPLFVALHRYVGSLADCFAGSSRHLTIPESCTSAATDQCGS